MSVVKLMFLLAMVHAEQPSVPNVELPPVQESGWSTWYGDGKFHGSITATGEKFNPLDSTCASRRIPLGTMILIEDVYTGKRVWCRVNDRGPYGALDKSGQWVLKLSSGDPGDWRGVLDRSLGTALRMKGVDVPDNLREAVKEARGVELNTHVKIRYWRRPRGIKLARREHSF